MHNATLIREADLENQLSVLQGSDSHPDMNGLFGPASLLWKVNRESLVFLGAGRALLLQLAHPWVAAAIADHSDVVNAPLTRFHRTFSAMFSMVFGTKDQALSAARKLYRRHAAVRGILADAAGPFPAGTPYWANDREVLQWVHSTLIETAILVYEMTLSPLAEEEREGFCRESCRFAGLFGLSSSSLPSDWTAFTNYTQAMRQSDTLTVTRHARMVTDHMFGEKIGWRCLPAWYQAFTAQLLPPRLREQFGLPYGEIEQRRAASALSWIRWVYPLLPYHLRYVGPYQEAQARLSGRPTPGIVTQSLNQLWIGQRLLS
jgi:uncharacterized protein (DUF2236 family)